MARSWSTWTSSSRPRTFFQENGGDKKTAINEVLRMGGAEKKCRLKHVFAAKRRNPSANSIPEKAESERANV
jgi:hypothetical protein